MHHAISRCASIRVFSIIDLSLSFHPDFTCRTVADNLRELFERSETHVALALKGVRHFRIASGPTPLPTTGYQTRLLIATAQLRYFRPHQ